MKKNLILIYVLSLITSISCQENKQEKIIEEFIISLFNNELPANEVVDRYIEIQKGTTNDKMTLEKRIKGAEGLINETRKGKGEKGMWIIPDYAIKQITNPKVFPFKDYESLSKIKLNKIDSIRDRVYVLLDEEKKEILQYFLLNESKTKIISYSLLVKDGTDGSFFTP